MYSSKIIEHNLARLSDTLGVRFTHYDDDLVDEMTAHLKGLVKSYDKEGNPDEWNRKPTQKEQAYIDNERIVCKYDFQYFANDTDIWS